MKIRTFLFQLLTLLIAVNSVGQTLNSNKLDSLLNLLSEKNKAMGSIALSENGKIIYSKAIGYSMTTPQVKIAANENTKYRIGSISKMFTASIVFQLIEEGKLELGTCLDKYFTTIPNSGSITIGQMLGHRSGIHSFTSDSDYTGWMIEPKTHAEIIRIISASRPEFEPDAKSSYSNSNYVLLGYIVENICNKPYNEVLNERICNKIGLKNTNYGGKININNNESYSYEFVTGWEKQPDTDMSIPHGAGAIISTPSDLVRFIEALFAGQLISEKSLSYMKTITDGYGMGMFRFPFDSKTVYGHSGGIDGFSSLLCYFPDDKLAIAYCSNGAVYSINDILIGALSIYFNMPYALPEFTTYTVNSGELDKYLGSYSSTQMPLKITISKNNGALSGQATGQPSFPLEPMAEHVFKFEKAGIVIRFSPDKHEFVIEQGGGKYTYTRDK